jgi:nicotinamide mononucleotide adenylyltransferase
MTRRADQTPNKNVPASLRLIITHDYPTKSVFASLDVNLHFHNKKYCTMSLTWFSSNVYQNTKILRHNAEENSFKQIDVQQSREVT